VSKAPQTTLMMTTSPIKCANLLEDDSLTLRTVIYFHLTLKNNIILL